MLNCSAEVSPRTGGFTAIRVERRVKFCDALPRNKLLTFASLYDESQNDTVGYRKQSRLTGIFL